MKNVGDCYAALGIIHKLWTPVPGKGQRLYRPAKTERISKLAHDRFCDDGEITEFQIRTEKMDYEAKHGIAAHWAYSEAGKPKAGAKIGKKFEWIRQISEWQHEVSGSKGIYR